MRILFTGGSSFSGMWFVEALAAAGHDVVATMTKEGADAYEGVRCERVRRVQDCASETVFECRLGDDRFLDVIGAAPQWELLCHHAADVTNYKSPDFETVAAVANNTHRVREVLAALAERDAGVVLTGSVFEGGEGAGSDDLPHFSPYGLSKSLAAQVWKFEADRQGVGLDKFVIPNPFGPFEEPRFTSYLMRCWFGGKTAGVSAPAYVRDNIHVSLLARAYLWFAESATREGGRLFSPSGYVESTGRFAERMAVEMRERIELACELDLANQTEFDEPRIRIGTDPVEEAAGDWSESEAWDEFAAYYTQVHGTVKH